MSDHNKNFHPDPDHASEAVPQELSQTGPASNIELDNRSLEELTTAFALAHHIVYKQYLNELSYYPLVAPSQELLDEKVENCIRTFQLTQLTCKKGEDIFQKLSTVYHAAMSLGCSLFVMVDVEGANMPAKFYLGIRSANQLKDLAVSYNALRDGLLSNFPGTQIGELPPSKGLGDELNEIFGDTASCVSAVSCVAALRGKEKTENKGFVQGLEKLVDVMRGTPYTAIFIADPVSAQQQSEIRSGYEELYSTLSAFKKSTWSYNASDSQAVTESLSHGISESVTNGTSHIQSHTISQTKGTSNTLGGGLSFTGNFTDMKGEAHAKATTRTETTSSSFSSSSPTKTARLGGAIHAAGGAISMVGGLISSFTGGLGLGVAAAGAAISGVGAAMQGSSTSTGSSTSRTDALSNSTAINVARSLGLSGGLNGNYAHGWNQSRTEGDTESDGESQSITKGASATTTRGRTDTASTGRTLQIENVNKAVEELLARVDEQLKRTREGEDYGAYSCGAYFLSSKPETSLLAANTYRALMLGEGSSVESGAVNLWSDRTIVEPLKEYLRRFAQPVFAVPLTESTDECMLYSPSTIVSGLELPLHLGLPTKSVVGLPIIDHAEFGRNVLKTKNALQLGTLFHMGRIEEGVGIPLDKESLTAHTFITGSTGAGKSNTVYQLLNELTADEKTHFLVIEPAKGEYKDVFGGRDDVTVLGTNPRISPLLRLNPFSFPEEIHVLEHIDRLVEIFNACWPMYAAMPAVLKDAVETVYRNAGWDMTRSTNKLGYFPTFLDLLEELPRTIQKSNYSADTQSDYTGALITRVKSLTNGIIGQIFCSKEEISGEQLFDRNVIVDLSRIGSSETKSLLMGLLTMKLQEYRMSQGGINRSLRHITVLEEAHNLLRRTSAEQSQESSNLQGKSVEMIANAIAEMRTYGEGFIIADQSPGLMDMSVIRNTNTKIIMRLPDETDRQLVGKAAALSEVQIGELARLPKGVAAIYQNEWVEPVLCKVTHFTDVCPLDTSKAVNSENLEAQAFFINLLHLSESKELSQESVDVVCKWINRLNVDAETKAVMRQSLKAEVPEKAALLYNMFEGKQLILKVSRADSGNPSVLDEITYQIRDLYQIQDLTLAEEIRRMIFDIAISAADGTELRTKIQELERVRGGIF